MQKRWIMMLCVVVLLLVSAQAFAEYDKDLVVKAMRANVANLGDVKKAAQEGNFFTAAEKLMEIAKTVKSLDAFTPPKGTKEDWDKIHDDLIKAVFKAIGVCGEEDAKKLTTYLDEIGALMKQGHSMFR